MTRKLALLLVACLGLAHGSVWALGLGEIDVRSALNERFSAVIDLRRVEALSENEIIASLASADDFSRLGVQRFFYLSELQFSTDLSDRTRPRIVVSSNRPINEPFVHFVVDVRWPTGRMLREYTVLLDPPADAARPSPALGAAPQAGGAAPVQSGRLRTEPEASPGAGRFDGDNYGVTDRDDTLWAIALEVRPSSDVSVQQTMLALARLNPDAFIGGNINLLKAGYVLEVPDADEIRRLSRQDAVVQVAEHNARWRDGTPAMPVDARPEVATGEQGPRPAGELRLVAAEGDDVSVSREPGSSAAAAGTGETSATEGEALAEAEAELDATAAALRAAEQEREQAASELEELNRQLELRNQELARLQRQLAAQQSSSSAPAPASAAQGGGLFGFSPMLLGLALLVLIVIAAGVWLVLKRRSASDEADAGAVDEVEADSKAIEQTQLMSAISKEDLARAGVGAAASQGATSDGADDENDVIAEADVYMAYGRFSEAARVLESALEADGQRADLRLKLMEVLVETQDVDAFNAQAEALRGFADEQTIALGDDLAARLPGAVTSTGVTSEGAVGTTRSADEGEVSLDFDLGDDFGEPADLDSLDIDFDASTKAQPAAGSDAGDDDLLVLDGDESAPADAESEPELDLDLDLDVPDTEKAVEEDAAGGFELDLDLPGEDAAASDGGEKPAAAAESTSESDDFDFELPLDGDDDSAPRPDAAEGSAVSAETEESPLDLLEDEPASDDAARPGAAQGDVPAAEQADADPEFDLTLDGNSFVERPKAEVPAEGDDDDFEFEFDVSDDLEGPRAEAGTEAAPAATEVAADGDDDLDLDFDIDDLPADADGELATEAREEPAEDLSSTVTREPEDDEDVTLFRGAEAATDEDEDETSFEFELEGFDEESSEKSSTSNEELPVDLADDDLDFSLDLDDAGDETTTKLELARAYIDMGDEDGAKEILDEVVRDGSDAQQQEAAELLARLD